MAVSSYGNSTDSSGVVRILKDLDANIEGRHVLIVEDIVDSGLTLSYLLRNLRARRPASLEVCALLTKPARRKADIVCRYVGFEIPNRFAIGYGLDYGERYRSLPYVAALDEIEAARRVRVTDQARVGLLRTRRTVPIPGWRTHRGIVRPGTRGSRRPRAGPSEPTPGGSRRARQ